MLSRPRALLFTDNAIESEKCSSGSTSEVDLECTTFRCSCSDSSYSLWSAPFFASTQCLKSNSLCYWTRSVRYGISRRCPIFRSNEESTSLCTNASAWLVLTTLWSIATLMSMMVRCGLATHFMWCLVSWYCSTSGQWLWKSSIISKNRLPNFIENTNQYKS